MPVALNPLDTSGILLTYAADPAHSFYRVRPGDSLSEVLYRLEFHPVSGDSGSLQRTIELNPRKRSSRGDTLFPGEMIHLPQDYLMRPDGTRLPRGAEILPSGEVRFATGAVKGSGTSGGPADSQFIGDRKEVESGPAEFTSTPASPTEAALSPPPDSSLLSTRSNQHEVDHAFGVGPQYRFTTLSASDITVEQIPVLAAKLSPQLILYTRGRTRVGADAQISYLLGRSVDSYTIGSGYRVGAGSVLLYQDRSGHLYRLSIGYRTRTRARTILTRQKVKFRLV